MLDYFNGGMKPKDGTTSGFSPVTGESLKFSSSGSLKRDLDFLKV